MASRWFVISESFGRMQRLSPKFRTGGIDNAYAIAPSLARRFSSGFVPPSSTAQKGAGERRDVGLYHLTQLFGKFLKSGEDRKAAELMEGMTSLDSPAAVNVCNYLLNSCSKSRNPEMAKEVWSFMESNGVKMNKRSFGSMLCALSRGGCLKEAVDLLHQLFIEKEANVVMYNTVLNGCVHAKSKMHAARCVQLMESQGVSKDELSYIELIKLSGMRGDLEAARKWWKELTSCFSPSPSTRSPYIIALSRMNALTEARQVLQDMVSDLDLKVGPQSRHFKETLAYQSRDEAESRVAVEDLGTEQAQTAGASFKKTNLQGPAEESNVQQGGDQGEDEMPSFPVNKVLASAELPSLGPRLPKNASTSLKNLQNAYNSLMNAAGKANDHELAESLFAEMRQLGLKTDIYTYNALLRAVVEGRGVNHGLRIVKSMGATGLQPNVHSWTALLEGYCQNQQLTKAEDVLRYMERGNHSQKPTRHAYNIMLKACASLEDPIRALQVFGRMKEVNVAPDSCTYVELLAACGSAQTGEDRERRWSQKETAKRVTAIELDMAQSGVQHTPETLTTVMRVLGAEGLTDAMLQRLEAANVDGQSLLDAASFNTVILSCLKAKQVQTGWDIYRQMKMSGVKPDVYTYNILVNGCARDKNLSTAFELVDTMRQEGLTPDVVTFNSLLKVICHCGEMDVVLDLLQKMRACGVQPDSATFNTILTSASYHKRVDVTEHVVEEMRRRNVSPDQHTLLPVVSIYMHAGQTEDALEALSVLSIRMLDGKASHRESKTQQIQNVLEELARQNLNLEDETKQLLKDAVLLTSPDSLAVYMAALTGLVKGESDTRVHEHSSWADRLSSQYDEMKIGKFVKSSVC